MGMHPYVQIQSLYIWRNKFFPIHWGPNIPDKPHAISWSSLIKYLLYEKQSK